MHIILYYILFFIVVGGIGMAVGNRKATPAVRRSRWLKFIIYIFITAVVIAVIIRDHFEWLALLLVLVGLFELGWNNFSPAIPGRRKWMQLISFIALGVICFLFLHFSVRFQSSFLLFTYFQVLVFDGFCQVCGQLWGKHPIAPAISPAKTWEGFFGGFCWSIIAAIMGMRWVNLDLLSAIAFGAFTGLTAFAGDMLASWYKRKLGVKDYSNWLPGQGGFLDRFDSFFMTGALYYACYIAGFVPSLSNHLKPI